MLHPPPGGQPPGATPGCGGREGRIVDEFNHTRPTPGDLLVGHGPIAGHNQRPLDSCLSELPERRVHQGLASDFDQSLGHVPCCRPESLSNARCKKDGLLWKRVAQDAPVFPLVIRPAVVRVHATPPSTRLESCTLVQTPVRLDFAERPVAWAGTCRARDPRLRVRARIRFQDSLWLVNHVRRNEKVTKRLGTQSATQDEPGGGPEQTDLGYAELKRRIVDSRLLDEQRGYYYFKLVSGVAIFSIAVGIALVSPWVWLTLAAALLLAFASTQLGLLPMTWS